MVKLKKMMKKWDQIELGDGKHVVDDHDFDEQRIQKKRKKVDGFDDLH